MRWVSYEEVKAFYREHGSAILLAVAAVVFFISLYYVLDTYPPKDDVLNFYKQAEMIKDGMVPYRDFVFEFPPFALLFFLIPSMFTSELDVYAQIFGVMVTLISLICLFYVLRISERMGVNRAVVTFVFVALMLLYYKELVVKFDTIPMMLTVMAIYYFQRGSRYAAYGLAMAGALVKIYPIFLVVLFLILDLVDRHDSRRVRVIKGFCACVAVGLVSLLPLLAAGASFGDVMSFLTFHTERGFQVESVMGVIIQGLGLLGLTSFSLVNIYGTYDVISPVSDVLLPFWNPLVAVLMVFAFYLIYRHASVRGAIGPWCDRFRRQGRGPVHDGRVPHVHPNEQGVLDAVHAVALPALGHPRVGTGQAPELVPGRLCAGDGALRRRDDDGLPSWNRPVRGGEPVPRRHADRPDGRDDAVPLRQGRPFHALR